MALQRGMMPFATGSVRGRGGLSRRAGGVTWVAIGDVGLWWSCERQPQTEEIPDDRDRAMEPPLVRGRWRGMPLIELLQKHDEGDFLRAVTEAVLQTLMDLEREEIDPGDRF